MYDYQIVFHSIMGWNIHLLMVQDNEYTSIAFIRTVTSEYIYVLLVMNAQFLVCIRTNS